MKNKRGEISYTSTSIAIIITVIVGAIVFGAFLWIMRGPLAGRFQSFGKEQEGNIIGFTKLIFDTREDDPFKPAKEDLIPDGATYYCIDGTELPGNGTNCFPSEPAFGDRYVEGDYEYTYKEDDGYYVLGWQVVARDKELTEYGVIRTVVAKRPVTNMNGTFYECWYMTASPAIPSSVTRMNGTFGSCYKLTEAPVLPDGLTSLNGTFRGCMSLVSAPVIPSGVTEMQNAFADCDVLKSAPVLPNQLINMRYAFENCRITSTPDIPYGVINMNYAFRGCQSLTTVSTIPSTVDEMEGAFSGCSNIVGLTVDANPSSYMYALSGTKIVSVSQIDGTCTTQTKQNLVNTNLGNFTRSGKIPTGGKYVKGDLKQTTYTAGNSFPAVEEYDVYYEGDYQYTYSKTLYEQGDDLVWIYGWKAKVVDTSKATYSIPLATIAGEPVNSLMQTYDGCKNLKESIPIHDTVWFAYYTFNGCSSIARVINFPVDLRDASAMLLGCTALTEVPTLPDSITEMSSMFSGCSSLKKISGNFPSQVTDMFSTFYNCASLVSVPRQIPYKVENMGYTFENCTNFNTQLIVPSSVTFMNSTFRNCASLTGTITINANLNTENEYSYYETFYGTTKPITIKGSSPNLQLLKQSANNNNVTIG